MYPGETMDDCQNRLMGRAFKEIQDGCNKKRVQNIAPSSLVVKNVENNAKICTTEIEFECSEEDTFHSDL